MRKGSRTRRRLAIRNRLWQYRRRMGYTQRQVAVIIGCRAAADISQYEHGHRIPSLMTALKLEIAYRAPVAFLFADHYRQLKEMILGKDEKVRAESNRTMGARP